MRGALHHRAIDGFSRAGEEGLLAEPQESQVVACAGERLARGIQNVVPVASELVEQALRAGALGFSTSRTPLHRSKDGELVPGTDATSDELLAIGDALAHAGLAEAYTRQAFLRASSRDEPLRNARAAVGRALELDPDLAEAHTLLKVEHERAVTERAAARGAHVLAVARSGALLEALSRDLHAHGHELEILSQAALLADLRNQP